ncbi:Ty-3/Gypsy retrotransposon polyprotein, partial [Trifolium medium]|nr:Ty-3/Gypsy retrotransposon polyprotein [Trifolium medium]
MSSSYHPQSDGQTEVLNRVVEQYLCAFAHHKPTSWGKFLLWAEWSYNTSRHSGTEKSPYKITYGKPPPSIPQYLQGISNVEAVDDMLLQRNNMIAVLKQKLLKAQDDMKYFTDKQRREQSFEVGDLVMVKLRPYRQITAKE